MTGNVGGGVLFVITSFVNLDVGATVGRRKIGATTVTSAGGSTVIDFESGTNIVFRVGLAIGLGG